MGPAGQRSGITDRGKGGKMRQWDLHIGGNKKFYVVIRMISFTREIVSEKGSKPQKTFNPNSRSLRPNGFVAWYPRGQKGGWSVTR